MTGWMILVCISFHFIFIPFLYLFLFIFFWVLDIDKVIWHLYNGTSLDLRDLVEEEEDLEDLEDLEGEEEEEDLEEIKRVDATSSQAITVALTGFEKLLLTAANRIEVNLTPAAIRLTNITANADSDIDADAVDDDGIRQYLPMKMLGVKIGQITLLFGPALDALLGNFLFGKNLRFFFSSSFSFSFS